MAERKPNRFGMWSRTTKQGNKKYLGSAKISKAELALAVTAALAEGDGDEVTFQVWSSDYAGESENSPTHNLLIRGVSAPRQQAPAPAADDDFPF